jgi:phosphotransferase system HPr-like phosphotransfer protein
MKGNSKDSVCIKILLNSFDKVSDFVSDANQVDEDIDLSSDRYMVDAKSILGVYSLNLSKPMDMVIHAESSRTKEFQERFKRYIVE